MKQSDGLKNHVEFVQLNHNDKSVVEKNEDDKFIENSNENKHDVFVYKEGGWGWVVVLCSGYCFGILIGMLNNYALIYNEFDKVYNNTENHVFYAATIGSASTGIQYMTCALGSILIDLFGCRKIAVLGGLISSVSLFASAYIENMKFYILTYGFLFAVGQAFLLTSTMAILPHYFNKRISLANGIMNLIGAIIVVIFPIITNYILKNYSLVGTFQFLAVLNLLTVIMGLSYKSMLPGNKNDKKIDRVKNSFGLEILKKRKFIIWCIASFIGMFGYFIPVVNIDHFSIKRFPDSEPYIFNVIFGAASGVSAILFGAIGDLTKFNRVHYHTLVLIVYGIVQISIPYAQTFFVLLIQSAILGLMDGILLCFIVTISFDLSGSSKLANHAAGYYHVIIGPTSIAGPAIAGRIFEVTDSYDYAFYLGGATCLAGAIVLVIFIPGLDFIENRIKQKKNKSSS